MKLVNRGYSKSVDFKIFDMKRFLLSILFFVGVASSVLSQSEGDFRSRLDGNWSASDTWEEYVGGVWTNTANVPSGTENQIELVSGISVTIAVGNTINISAGSTLLINGTLILETVSRTNGVLRVGGVMTNNQGSLISGTAPNKLFFLSGGIYNHNFTETEGTIPTASWAASSTVNIIGYTSNGTAPSGLDQTFYDFNWNCPNMTTAFFDLGGELDDVNGNLTISSTGTGSLSMSDFASSTINIDGSFTISGTSEVYFNYQQPVTYNIGVDLTLSSSLATYFGDEAVLTLNISNDLIVNGSGTYDFGGFSGIAATDILIGNNFTISGGTIQATGSGIKTINFNSGLVSNYSKTGGSVSGAINYSITNSTDLNLGTSSLQGSGNFTLGSGSKLLTSNLNGIESAPTNAGAIQLSGTRTYNAGSIIEYNGTSTQDLGDGFPSSGVDFIVNNSGGGVNMNSPLTIAAGRSLTLTAGALNIGGNTLTINGDVVTTSGSISGGEFANLTIGGSGPVGTLPFSGDSQLQNFTINRSDVSGNSVTIGNNLLVNGTLDLDQGEVILGGDLSLASTSTLDQAGGSLSINGNQLTISGNFTQSGGSLTSTSLSSLLINGAGSLPSPVSFTGDINTITLNRSSSTFNTAASSFTATNLNLFSGTLDGTAISIANGGLVERRTSGVLTNALTPVGSYNLIYDHSTGINTGAELPTSTTAINNIEKRGTGVLTVQNNFTANGSLTFTNGSFDAGANTISSNGDLVTNAASTLSNSTITFDGITNLSGSNTPTFGSITVTGTFNPTSSLNINGDITNNGTLNSSAGTLTINATSQLGGSNPITVNNFTIGASGNVTASSTQALEIDGNLSNSGSFTANGGTVIFGGTTSISGTVPDFANVQIDGILNAPAILNISGGLTNNGTFNDNDGIINLNGTGTRTIAGTSPFNVYTLNVTGGTVNNNNTGGVTIENGINVGASTIFDLDGAGSGNLTLRSIEGQDAYIGEIPIGSSISGNINVQRAIYTVGGDSRGYHIVGFPVDGLTVAEIQDEISVTGPFTGASPCPTAGCTYSIYSFNETAAGNGIFSNGYTGFPSTGASQAFNRGDGYYIFTYAGETPVSLEGNGSIFSGNFSKTLSRTGTSDGSGWHMVSNPYPATTDWSLWGNSNVVGSTAYLWNPGTGGYEIYDGSVQQLIPQGQGFFVRAISDGVSLTATEATKVEGNTPTYLRQAPQERFEIILQTPDYDDKTIVSFNENATDNFEPRYDAPRLLNTYETLSTLTSDNEAVKVNRLASLSNTESCSRSIFLKIEQMVNGKDYKLLFRDIDNLPSQSFVLMDHYLEQTVKVTNATIYDFQVNSDAASKNDARFELILSSNQPSQVVTVAEDICPEQNALLTIENSQSFVNYLVLKNNEVISSVAGSGADLGIEISNDILIDNVNDFVIKGFVSGCDTVSVGNAQIQVNEALTFNNVVNGSSICNVDTQAPFSLSTQIGANYYILNGTDTLQTIQGTGNNYEGFIASNELNDGLNEFVIAAEKDGCQSGTLTENLQIEVQNLTIDSSISFTSENTCVATASSISFNGQAGVEYQIFKGTTLVNSITADSTEQIVNIPEANLVAGFNEFTVVAQYGECAEYEFPNPVQIQVEESINTNLSLITENICGDANTSITIENAQAGKTYTLQSAGSNITSLTADVDGDLIFNLNSNQISTGLNELDIQIEGQICGAVLSANKAVFSVYESINSNLDYISANVCNATEASVGISNAQVGKTYRLYKGGSLVESIQATTDGQLLFAEANNQLEVGSNTFNLQIESAGCGVVDVAETLSLTLFESINPDLAVISSDICTSDDQVTIEITNAQEGKTYELVEAGNVIATQTASSANNLMFNLASDQFSIGNNVLNINISDANCGTTSAIQSVEFDKYDVVEITPIDTQNICLNENVTIDLSANATISSYQLFIGDELIQEVAGTSLNLSPTETTTYALTGIPENGCSVNTINFTIEVTDLAKPGILASANVLESSIDGDSYQWYLNGEVLSGETSKVVVANQSGDYSVEVTKGSCSTLSDAFTFNEEVLNANKALLAALNLYPNPVEDKMFIELNDIYSVNVTIFTLSGKFIDSFEISSNKSEIDMSKFSNGTYLIQFESEKGSVTKRIIKQ